MCCKIQRFEDKEIGENDFAEISHTDRPQCDLGLGGFVISGKNLVSEIFKVKTRKIDILTTYFCRSRTSKKRIQLET